MMDELEKGSEKAIKWMGLKSRKRVWKSKRDRLKYDRKGHLLPSSFWSGSPITIVLHFGKWMSKSQRLNDDGAKIPIWSHKTCTNCLSLKSNCPCSFSNWFLSNWTKKICYDRKSLLKDLFMISFKETNWQFYAKNCIFKKVDIFSILSLQYINIYPYYQIKEVCTLLLWFLSRMVLFCLKCFSGL